MMKNVFKTMLTVGFLCGFVSSTHAESPWSVNKKWNIGILGGCMGYADDLTMGAFGMNTTVKGFYADFLVLPRAHVNDTNVEKWDDKQCFGFHAGYQIPIVKALRIIPMIGYSHISKGTTDGSSWSVGSNGIVNSYKADTKINEFDYGAMVVVNIKKVNIDVAVTRHAIFGGVALELGRD